MATIGEEFQLAAQEIIYDFSTELGDSTFYSKTGDGYVTDTGVNTSTFDPYTLLLVSDAITIESFKTGNAVFLDPQFLKDHRLMLIAGLDLAVVPKVEDEVAPVGEGKRFKVDLVLTDQYGALYSCYVNKKPVASP